MNTSNLSNADFRKLIGLRHFQYEKSRKANDSESLLKYINNMIQRVRKNYDSDGKESIADYVLKMSEEDREDTIQSIYVELKTVCNDHDQFYRFCLYHMNRGNYNIFSTLVYRLTKRVIARNYHNYIMRKRNVTVSDFMAVKCDVPTDCIPFVDVKECAVSDRDLEILKRSYLGYSEREIAETLNVSRSLVFKRKQVMKDNYFNK